MTEVLHVEQMKPYRDFLQSNEFNTSVLRKLVSNLTSNLTSIEIFLDDMKESKAYWVSPEQERAQVNRVNLQKKNIILHELYTCHEAHSNILQEVNDVCMNIILPKVQYDFQETETRAFLYGKGNAHNEPDGLLTSGDIKKVEEKDTIFTTLTTMKREIDTSLHNGLVWLMNDMFFAKILEEDMRNIHKLIQNTEKLHPTILGIPVYVISQLKDEDLCILLNPKKAYCIVDYHKGIEWFPDKYTKKPLIDFYFVKRVGGFVLNKNAYIVCKTAQAIDHDREYD